jgi:hypothetical protein
MTSTNPSPRARNFWKRLLSWYGSRLGDHYGLIPPPDWAEMVDHSSQRSLARALAEIRIECPVHPPTFPQFAAIVSRFEHADRAGPSVPEQLSDYVVNHRTLTRGQLHGWTFVYRELECVGVDIPSDGETPGFRVRVEDLPHAP